MEYFVGFSNKTNVTCWKLKFLPLSPLVLNLFNLRCGNEIWQLNLQLFKLEILQSLNPVFLILGINLLKTSYPYFQSTLRFLLLFAISTAFYPSLLPLVFEYCHCTFLFCPSSVLSQHPDDTKLNHVSPTKSIPFLTLNQSIYPYCGLQAFMWPSLHYDSDVIYL